jgi:hypothetical protein
MAPGDIAFKSNFATLDPQSGIVLRRRADRRFEDLGPVLCAALDGLRLPSFPQVCACKLRSAAFRSRSSSLAGPAVACACFAQLRLASVVLSHPSAPQPVVSACLPLLCNILLASIMSACFLFIMQHCVSVRYATEHRCGVVVRGPGLTDQISGTDPLKDNLPLLVRLLTYFQCLQSV